MLRRLPQSTLRARPFLHGFGAARFQSQSGGGQSNSTDKPKSTPTSGSGQGSKSPAGDPNAKGEPLPGPMQSVLFSMDPNAGSSPEYRPGKHGFDASDMNQMFGKPPEPGSGAAEERRVDEQARKNYVRSQEFFKKKTITLKQSYAGDEELQIVTTWERFWWDWIRWFWTWEVIAGKDKFGNIFTKSWSLFQGRSEKRKVHRRDKTKRFQPYGALPTDSRLWEAWLRLWRHEPPTPEEEAVYTRRNITKMGPHNLGEEKMEDTIVRTAAHSTHGGVLLQELDKDENYNRFFMHFEDARKKENDPAKESSSWTNGFARGDWFYNEEEVDTMRTNMANIFRDRDWQALEMKRQTRMRKAPKTVHLPDRDDPDFGDPNGYQGEPRQHGIDRIDGGVPSQDGVEQLTTPEIQRLHVECDALEEERLILRKELGLTDVVDFRDGRAPIVQDKDPYAQNPLSKRYKPKVWEEGWGWGGGHSYNG